MAKHEAHPAFADHDQWVADTCQAAADAMNADLLKRLPIPMEREFDWKFSTWAGKDGMTIECRITVTLKPIEERKTLH
jgi:hypothetical protein